MGLLPLAAGSVSLGDKALSDLPAHEVPRQGIGYIPQGRRLFTELTVAENIEIGLMVCGKGAATREKVLQMFPRLRERLSQRAETLSGGEQQMLATARALCLEPSVLLLDEPTEGLQPSMAALIRDTIRALRADGVAVVLVEQRIDAVLALADRVTFLENGHGRETVQIDVLRADRTLFQKYVGV
jgi:branched-chain amino acid transport system ATP-binding protein